MFAELLRAEWDRRRALLGLLCLVFLAGPMLYLPLSGLDDGNFARRLVSADRNANLVSVAVLVLAACWGAGAWSPERRSRWGYALSLPVGRARLFAVRYLASLAWLALPCALLACGALAISASELPNGVYSYAPQYTLWSALLSWLVFSVAFVLAARFENPTLALLVPVAMFVALEALQGVTALREPLTPVVRYLEAGELSPLHPFREYASLVGY